MRRCDGGYAATRVESFAEIRSGFGLHIRMSCGLALVRRSGRWSLRTKFFGREFAILIEIQFAQRLGRGIELCCGESTILILIQGCNYRRWAMALWSLRSLWGPRWAQLIDGQFAIAIGIERLQCSACGFDFIGTNDTVLIFIEQEQQRRRWTTMSLAFGLLGEDG